MFEECLLGVQAVLRLVPDRRALAVEHVLGDLLARMRGQAVQHDGVVARLRQQVGVDAVGREQLAAAVGVVLVAHAHPDVGVDGVRAPHRLGGLHARRLGQRELRRRGHGHLHAGDPSGDQERAGHVVAVAHVGELQPLERSEALEQGHQVRERLAGVVLLGEHVDHGDRGVLRELGHGLVRARPDADGVDHPRQHERHVARRLAARHLELALAQDQRMPAQLVDARLEGHARAGGRLVEHERDALAVERARGQAVGLELDRPLQEPPLLSGRKLLSGQEVLCQCESSAGISTTAATSRPTRRSSRCARGSCA